MCLEVQTVKLMFSSGCMKAGRLPAPPACRLGYNAGSGDRNDTGVAHSQTL